MKSHETRNNESGNSKSVSAGKGVQTVNRDHRVVTPMTMNNLMVDDKRPGVEKNTEAEK